MKRKIFCFLPSLAMAILVSVAPAILQGQGNTWAGTSLQQMVEGTRWRLGLFRINAALELMNAGYDTDIYYGYFPERVPDFTISAGIPVQVIVPASKKIVFELFDYPQYVFYLDTQSERAWNNTVRGQVHFALDRFYIQAGGGFANVRQRLSPELNINIRRKEYGMHGLVLWQASRVTSFAMLYGGTTYNHEDLEYGGANIADTLNRKEHYLDFITYLQPNPRIRFFVDGQYGSYRFKEATSNRDARSFGIYGGLNFVPREGVTSQLAGVQGSISLGYKRFDMIAAQLTDGSGFAGAVSVSVGLLKRTIGRIFLSRDFEFSVYSDGTYYTSTAFGGGITRLLSRRATISYDLSFDRSSYPAADTGSGGIPPNIYNRYTIHMFSLNFRIARNLEIMFLGTIAKRVFDEMGHATNRNFFGFNLVYGVSTREISIPVSALSR